MLRIICGLAALFGVMAATPTHAGDDIEVDLDRERVHIEFPESMRVLDNAIPDRLLISEPARRYACAWEDDHALDCEVLGDPLPPATPVMLRMAAGLFTAEGVALPAQVFKAETDRPRVTAHIDKWVDDRPRITVYSTLPATADAAARALHLRSAGRRWPVSLHARPVAKPEDGVRFDVTLPDALPHGSDVELRVEPGLRSIAGPLPGTQNDALVRFLDREPFQLREIDCSGPKKEVQRIVRKGAVATRCVPGEPVWLLFSSPMDDANRAAFATALPAGIAVAEWSSEAWWLGRRHGEVQQRRLPARVRLKIDTPSAILSFQLASTLHDERGRVLQPVRLRIETTEPRPRLEADAQRLLLGDPERAPLRSVNAASVELRVQALGEHFMETDVSASGGDGDVQAATSALALAEGGWARWRGQAGGIDVAAPRFELAAYATSRTVVAWATEWAGGDPIAGAEIELFFLQGKDPPKRIAEGRSGADGVARLALPDDFHVPANVEAPTWLLRARSGQRLAVLPLGGDRDGVAKLGRDTVDLKLWGVADRPLYRAGDTVRYRLWLRERRDGRLRRRSTDVPVALALVQRDDDKQLRDWSATTDDVGAIAGETRLPEHLVDGEYCIRLGGDEYQWEEGLCFFVGTYRPQDLWAQASTEDRLLRDGDDFAVDLSAGYYSGGVAAGLDMTEVSANLEGRDLSEAYPDFAGYTFLDAVRPDDDVPLAGTDDLRVRLDGDGKARIALPVRFDADDKSAERPAFGRLNFTARVKLDAGESTTTNVAQARYARFDRYVGLKVEPRWFDATTPLRLTGVVIDAEGRAQPGARIEVSVEYRSDDAVSSDGASGQAKRERIATCTLIAGATATCDVPRKRSGRYALVARSGDAAPAELVCYIWVASDAAVAAAKFEAEVLEHPTAAKPEVRVLLRHPHKQARALLLVESEGALLERRVVMLDVAASELRVPVSARPGSAVNLHVLVRERAGAIVDARGLRRPSATAVLSVAVDMPPRERANHVVLSLDAERAEPGRVVRIRLRNPTDAPRSATLAVVDDALLALGARWWSAYDPYGTHWLGMTPNHWQHRPDVYGFWTWKAAPWRLPLDWPGAKQPRDDVAAKPDDMSIASQPEEPTVEFDDPSPVDRPAAAPDASRTRDRFSGYTEGQGELDSITVTGSRIRRVEVEASQPVIALDAALVDAAGLGSVADLMAISQEGQRDDPRGEPLAEIPRGVPMSAEARALFGARLRQRFAETALWMPDLRLAPGETRDVEFAVPDNLTRWRVVAWSSDQEDGFDQSGATLEVGLPLEVRVQAPVRLYPGDSTQLVANLRHGADATIAADATLRVDALGTGTTVVARLPPKGTITLPLRIAPGDEALTGDRRTLDVVAAARHGEDRDAVSASIELASPRIETRKVQVGWLGAADRVLPLPVLPAGAGDPRLSVSLLPGADGLVRGWIDDLRVYPHRCWEQILSRGVAAAIAMERDGAKDWPDAKDVVREALDNAPVFMNEDGSFRYFADADETRDERGSVVLTAYSLRALRFLQAFGHPVDAAVLAKAESFLEESPDDDDDAGDAGRLDSVRLTEDAFAVAAVSAPDADVLARLFGAWDKLPLPARVATARAMAAADHPDAAKASSRLLAETKPRGESRAFDEIARHDRWMSSSLREQCELIALLSSHPALSDAAMRRSLIAGLGDLYAGGIAKVDTQTGASCLMAMNGVDKTSDASSSIGLGIAFGDVRTSLALAPGTDAPVWSRSVATKDATRTLVLDPDVRGETPASYRVEYRYTEDARKATSTAVGFSLQREYRVLRNGAWTPVHGQSLRDGDWVRVTLRLDNGAARHFVAITDAVPGGLRPTDLALGGVAGLDLKAVSDTGALWFGTRRLDPRAPKFYAEYLPSGRHEVHYFARVGNAGDYLAAPAEAELMYGAATRARTAAGRIRIESRVE